MRDDAVLRRALPLGRGLGRVYVCYGAIEIFVIIIIIVVIVFLPINHQSFANNTSNLYSEM